MKTLYNILSSSGRRIAATATLLVTMMLCSMQVSVAGNYWADYYDENAENMYFTYKRTTSDVSYSDMWICGDIGEVWHGCNASGNSTLSLGNVTELYIDAFFVSMYKRTKDNSSTEWGNICQVGLYYTVDNWTTTHEYLASMLDRNSSKSDNITTYNERWGKSKVISQGINLISKINSVPGNYTLKYNFNSKVKQDNGSTVDCGSYASANLKLDNGYQDYQVNFTYPGFKSQNTTTLNFGTKPQGSTSAAQSVTYNHYGTALSMSNCSITNSSGNSGTVVDYYAVTSVGESGVSIVFSPKSTTPTGTATAWLHITDAHGKSITAVQLNGTVEEGAQVTAGDEPVVNPGPQVTLYGYILQAGCVGSVTQNYRPYGFYYIKKEGHTCNEVLGGSSIEVDNGPLTTGGTFNATITSDLELNTTYYYKPYIKNVTDGTVTVSNECYEFTTKGACEYPQGDVIYYTIDASQTADPCNLIFPTFEAALADLKSHNTNGAYDYWWDAANSMLKKEVRFQVVASGNYGVKGNRIDFSNINKYNETTGAVPTQRFYIEPKVEGTKPVIYGMNLANSRWVTVRSMDIQRNSPGVDDGIGHSCILIGLNEDTNNLAVGKMSNAGLEFIGCLIEGDNFCCIHGNGVDGLYMENNNLDASCTNSSNDTKNWGASLKFMNSKNIKLVRNNFKGAHSNNIFAQNTQYMLLMENVFWNNNNAGFEPGENDNTPAIVRLVNYGASDVNHKIKNIGMYYNTMYLAESNNTGKFDFLVFGGNKQGQVAEYYDASTIEFKYNNCYSYSTNVTGRSTSPDPFIGLVTSSSTTVAYNNFWSKYDKNQDPQPTYSCFSFGGNILTPYASLDPGDGLVCETAPNTPEGIIIKDNGENSMNRGPAITSDVSGLGAEEITTDRKYNDRPNTDTWTYGAYQTTVAEGIVEEIIWHATTPEDTEIIEGGVYYWDNRNNWYRRDSKGNLVTVNCVDRLSDNLRVIIPNKDDTEYKSPAYPTMLPWDDPKRYGATSRYGVRGAEAVFAGANGRETHDPSVSMYAKNIVINYGGALMGIENLNDGTKRYSSAQSELQVRRKEWTLVGSVIDGVVSGDFYIKDHLPHVYMQQFSPVSDDVVQWGTPFTSKEQPVSSESSFAIFIADQYGEFKLPASIYYKKEYTGSDADEQLAKSTQPWSYTKEGNFVYDHADAEHGDGYATIKLKPGYNILNNAYPAALKASNLNSALSTLLGSGNYSLQMYDYTINNWTPYASLADPAKTYIQPQSGFIINNKTGSTSYLKLTPTLFDATVSTQNKLKSASADAGVVIMATNAATRTGSVISVWSSEPNVEKAFNGSVTDNPELYIIDGTQKYSVFQQPDMQAVVPLGIRNKSEQAFSVKFSIRRSVDLQSVILEDHGVEPVAKYDLLNGDAPVFTGIPSGDTNGRFFLNINYAEESAEQDIPTVIIDHDSETSICGVDIYAVEKDLHVVAQDIDVIKSITITDLAGRTFSVKPSDAVHSINSINALSGTYIVTVITERCAAQQKVIIK